MSQGRGELAVAQAAAGQDGDASADAQKRTVAGPGLGIGPQMGLSIRISGDPALRGPGGRGANSDVVQTASALSTSAPLRPSGLALAAMHTHAQRKDKPPSVEAMGGVGAGVRTISGDAIISSGSSLAGTAPERRFLDDTVLDDSCSWSQFRAQRLEVTALQDQIRDLQLAHDMARARLREADRTAASLLRDNKTLKQAHAQLARENAVLKARLQSCDGGNASAELQGHIVTEQDAVATGTATRHIRANGRARRGSAMQQANAAAPAPSQVTPRGGAALRNGLLMRVLRPHGAQQVRAGPAPLRQLPGEH